MKEFVLDVLVEALILILEDVNAILIQVVATLIGMCISIKINK